MKEKITDRFIGKFERSVAFPPEKRLVIYDTEMKGFALVVQPSGSMSYILRYRRPGDRAFRDYTIGRTSNISTAAARKEALNRSGQVNTGIDIQQAKHDVRLRAERERMQTLKVFFDEKYKPYCEHEMRNGQGQLLAIKTHFVDRWPNRPLKDINTFLVQNWRKEKLKIGRGPGGVNRPVSALKAMLNRAVEWEVIERNPLAAIKPLKEDSGHKVRFLDEQEEERLRKALDAREAEMRTERISHNQWRQSRGKELRSEIRQGEYSDYLKPMVLLALNTGLRRGEIFNLVRDDIDLNSGKTGRIVVQGAGAKSGNTRTIPLTNEARELLTIWIQQSDPSDLLFPSPVTRKRLNNINRSWAGVVQAAELNKFRFHDLRHTFASKLAMRGVDLYTIKEFLGHASIETTQRYAHLAPDHKSKAIASLNA